MIAALLLQSLSHKMDNLDSKLLVVSPYMPEAFSSQPTAKENFRGVGSRASTEMGPEFCIRASVPQCVGVRGIEALNPKP